MKNMKKKVVIITAMVLLLAAVLVMSISTFAKYTTSTGAQSANATAAKWGFVVNANANELFPAKYGEADGEIVTAWEDGESVSVASSAAVVAPGTSGSMTFGVSGTAEVLAKITFQVSGTDLALTKGEESYSPIVWTLTKDGSPVSLESNTLAGVTKYFAAGAQDATVQAGDEASAEYVLTWTWAYNNTAASGITGLDGNQADTIMGQLAADPTNAALADYALTPVVINVSVSVDQIQA